MQLPWFSLFPDTPRVWFAPFMPGIWHSLCCRECNGVRSGSRWGVAMVSAKKLAMYLLAALVLAGAYDALRNLPVLSGCNFYSECPTNDGNRAAD
jgi:hypothetical protein